MKKLLLPIFSAILISCSLCSCLRLDNNLFDNTKLSTYLLDASTGPQEITLDSSYTISPALEHIIQLQSNDNGNLATIYGVYIGDMNRIATDTVIMYFHGTKDNLDYYWNRAKLLANVGGKNRYGVFIIDYRGYGMSQGKPTESGIHADANAAIAWLQNEGLTGDRLIVYGFSLGTAAATWYTANPQTLTPSKLILEAPFASAAEMVNEAAVLALPASYFTNLKVDNSQEIKRVQQPFLWMHGVDDDFISISQGQIVYNNYTGAYSEAHKIPVATHTNVPSTWGFDNYKTALEHFIVK